MVESAKEAGIVRVVRDSGRAPGPIPQTNTVNGMDPQAHGYATPHAGGYAPGYNPAYANYAGGMFGEGNPFQSHDDLKEILRKLWRGKWFIVATMLVCFLLAVLMMSVLPRKYSASSSVLIDATNKEILVSENSRPVDIDEAHMISQAEVIRSRGFAESIVRSLGLVDRPEFNESLREPSWIERAWGYVIEQSGGEGATNALSNPVGDLRIPNSVTEEFMKKLYVRHKNETRIIEIHFTSRDPELAKDVPNSLADLYRQWELEQKFNEVNARAKALSPKIQALEEEVRNGEAEIVALTQRIGGISGEKGSLFAQQLTELTSQILQTEAQLSELESRAENIGIGESELVARLRSELAGLKRQSADLSTTYGAKHPIMQKMQSQIVELESQIGAERGKASQDRSKEITILNAKLSSLRGARSELEEKLTINEGELPILQAVERKVQSNRDLLARLRTEYQLNLTKAENEELIKADAEIVSYADVPEKASSPKPGLILPVVLMGSLILGLILAFMREKLEPGFLSGLQLEKEFGIPVLALVPATNKFLSGEPDILHELRSPFTESMRSIGTSIRLFDIDNPPKVVLVTSAEPSEGKSTIAISVARVQALAGLKVIIVDTDIRKPVVHERLAVRRAPGLVEVLDGKHTLSEAIVTDEKTGVDVLPVGVPVSTDTLAFDRMRNFLNDLRDQYDLIIVDSAPILAVSDARILPAIADMTIFSVRWRETRREVVRLAVKQLRESGARLGGIVLSRVNIKSHRQYGYGDSALYSGKLKKYYTQTS